MRDVATVLQRNQAKASAGVEAAALVEVTGVVACDAPLLPVLRPEPSAVVVTRMTRSYVRRIVTSRLHGETQDRYVDESQTVTSRIEAAPFRLESDGAAVAVDTAAVVNGLAELDLEPTAEAAVSDPLEIKASQHLFFPELGPDCSHVAYTRQQFLLPVGEPAFALGYARQLADGSVQIFQPRDAQQRLMLSVRSRDELVEAEAREWRHSFWWGLALGLGGLALVVYDAVASAQGRLAGAH